MLVLGFDFRRLPPLRRAWCLAGLLLGVSAGRAGAQTGVPTAPSAAAPCRLSLAGKVVDAATGETLPGAVLLLETPAAGETADPDGHYHFHGLCAGPYRLRASFVGYADAVFEGNLRGSAERTIRLKASAQQLGGVQVTGHADAAPLVSQAQASLSGAALQQTRGLNLATALTGIAGVYAISTGPSIAKPVIHGLYGNRVLILNNGVRQEGQQWGADHAPEIDPFTATRLVVVKGAAGIRYGPDAIGGVVLVEPAALPDTAGVAAEINLVGMSNSRLGAASAFVQAAVADSSSRFLGLNFFGLSGRVQGTLRGGGNARTASYFLNNTGLREQNYSLALGYHRGRVGADVFFSRFDTRLGIFAGAETGSVADLARAIGRDRPLTPDQFGYAIARPYQAVVHELLKASAHANLGAAGQAEAVFARQTDARAEYGGQTPYNPALGDVPDLFLSLTSHSLDLAWHAPRRANWSGTVGLTGSTQANVRAYEFLIPNFRNYGAGAYALAKHVGRRLTLEGGLRYDYRWLRAFFLNASSLQVEQPTTVYAALTGTVGAALDLGRGLALTANLGSAWRPPTVNELYANGVHQSAASYEVGQPGLIREQSYTATVALSYAGTRLEGEIGSYANYVADYIFLQPALRFQRTVRGAYPVFNYQQANVLLRGLDARVQWRPLPALALSSNLSLLWAYNLSADDYLIFAPPQRLQNAVRYTLGTGRRTAYVELNNLLVARQTRAPRNGDYAPPPPGYALWGAAVGTTYFVGRQEVDLSVSATNLLNAEYRDYLNRFRYFAADLGRNVQVRVRVPLRW